MYPVYKDKDILLIYRSPDFDSYVTGDSVVVSTEYFGNVIKFLAEKKNDLIKLEACSSLSVDCHQLGWISVEKIQGKIVKNLSS